MSRLREVLAWLIVLTLITLALRLPAYLAALEADPNLVPTPAPTLRRVVSP